jgi:hypothetical protein
LTARAGPALDEADTRAISETHDHGQVIAYLSVEILSRSKSA